MESNIQTSQFYDLTRQISSAYGQMKRMRFAHRNQPEPIQEKCSASENNGLCSCDADDESPASKAPKVNHT